MFAQSLPKVYAKVYRKNKLDKKFLLSPHICSRSICTNWMYKCALENKCTYVQSTKIRYKDQPQYSEYRKFCDCQCSTPTWSPKFNSTPIPTPRA